MVTSSARGSGSPHGTTNSGFSWKIRVRNPMYFQRMYRYSTASAKPTIIDGTAISSATYSQKITVSVPRSTSGRGREDAQNPCRLNSYCMTIQASVRKSLKNQQLRWCREPSRPSAHHGRHHQLRRRGGGGGE